MTDPTTQRREAAREQSKRHDLRDRTIQGLEEQGYRFVQERGAGGSIGYVEKAQP